MKWKLFFKVFLLNVIGITAASTLLLGLFGLWLAGKEGFINGAFWGFTLGMVSVPFTAMAITSRYWGDYSGRFGKWWVDRETRGERPVPEDDKDRWQIK